MRIRVISFTVILLAAACAATFAGYGDNVSLKADRAFSNVLGCWLELPYQTYTVGKEEGLLRGATIGLGKGIVNTAFRLGSGAVDLVTFPVAFPRDWQGLMDPGYNPWVDVPEVEGPATGEPAVEKPTVEESARIK